MQAKALSGHQRISPTSNLGVGAVKHNLFRGGKSTLGISYLYEVDGSNEGGDGSGDDSGESGDGGGVDEGSETATVAMSASIAADIGFNTPKMDRSGIWVWERYFIDQHHKIYKNDL
ncbi:hypothetical protein Tco_1177037 [Tanacetum coccineum]